MECLRKCLLDLARNYVRMILLTNKAERAIAMLKNNHGGFDKIIEQLKDSSDFQEFSHLVENLVVTVENVGEEVAFHEQHCDQGVVEETSRISASAVGAAHGADPVG
jgi:hypothetical protein